MSHGCELRVPFLDPELVIFGINLPLKFLKENKINKKIIRDIANKLINNEIAYSPKRFVQSPQREWLSNSWSDLILELFSKNSNPYISRWIDVSKFLDYYIKCVKDRTQKNSFLVWQLLNLEIWAKQWFV